MTARARLDADRTAEPLTRIEHHPPHGGCIGPYMPLVNPEYVDENGKRTPLSAPAAPVHFPSPHVGLTWCGLPFDPPNNRALEGVDRNGLAFSTDMPAVTCPGCHADAAQPAKHDLTPSEVALAKMLEALYDPSLEKSEDRAILRMVGQLRREVFSAGYDPRGFTGNALLDRARKAGVL